MTPQLQKFLAEIGDGRALDIDQVFAAARHAHYSGPITFHCRNGIPHQLDIFATPIRLSIVEGLDSQKGSRSG